jgi:TRAP-type C4-dicarboxylate transport system permease small subunit
MDLIRTLQLIRTGIDLFMRFICFFTGSVMAVTLLLQVIFRYFLGSSLSWATELPEMLFPWLAMSGATIAAVSKKHLGVDYFVSKLSLRHRTWLLALTNLITIVALTTIAIVSFRMLSLLGQQATPVLGVARSYAFFSLPLGLICLAMVVASDTLLAFAEQTPSNAK